MELKKVIEAILFSAQKPLSPKELREVLNTTSKQADDETESQVKLLKKPKAAEIENALDLIAKDHEDAQRGFRLVCIAGSWQFVSPAEYHPWIRALLGEKPKPARLSQPALETLAIIAYRQPLTRSEMEDIRGVAVDGVVATLVERGLAEKVGQADLPGRPALYGTTPLFLEYFGLASLEDLPAADDLRRIPVQKPETLITASPDLATQPEDQMDLEEVEAGKPGGEEPGRAESGEGSEPAAEAEAAESAEGEDGSESEAPEGEEPGDAKA
jgi:segregation and condensation protein B